MNTEEAVKVLYVEDNPGDFRLVHVILQKENADQIILENAESLTAGLECLAHGNFDLILLDLNLPDSNGLDTFRTIKASAQDIPFIVLTGLDDETVGLQAINEGAQDYLIKRKITGDILVRAIKYAIWRKKAEREIRDKEEMYRAIFENTGTATIIVEEDSFISLANAEFEKLTGYKRDDIEGKKRWTEFVVEDDLKRMTFQHRLRREDPDAALKSYEFRLVDRSGQIRDILLTVDVIPGTKKSVASLLDITERKRSEQMLRSNIEELENSRRAIKQSQSLLMSVVSSPKEIVIFALDREYRYLIFNQNHKDTMKSIWGVDIELGHSMLEYIKNPEDCARAKLNFDQALRGETFIIDEVYGDIALQRRYYEDHYSPIWESDGSVIGLTVFLTDITERKRAEEALRQSEEKLAGLYASMVEGVALHEIIYDNGQTPVDYIITDVNPSFEKILDISRDEAVGQRASELYGAGHAPYLDIYARVASSGKPELFETYFEPQRKYFSISAFSLGQNKFATVFSDITKNKLAEDALRESEEKYRTLVENLDEGIQVIDEDGRIVFANQRMEKMVGYGRGELVGRNAFEMMDDKSRERAIAGMKRDITEGSKTQIELLNFHKNGTPINISLRGTPIKGFGGETLFLASVSDITESRRLENKLKWNAALLEAQVEASIDGILVVDENGQRVITNKRLFDMWGVPEEIRNTKDDAPLLDFVFRRTRDPNQFLDKVLHLYDHHNETSRDIIEFKDGMIFDRYSSPVLGKDGQYYGRIWTFRDITEANRAERTLREQYNFLQQLIDSIPNPIFYKDSEGVYIGCNKAFEAITGHSRDNIKGRSVYELYPKDLADIYHEADAKLIKNPGVQIYESSIANTDGSRREVMFSKATHYDTEGRLAGIAGVILDITDRKQAEDKIKASLKEKEVLLKEVHHRVKNNLGIISALLSLQSSYLAEEELKKIFRDSQNRVKSMALIHENLYESENLDKINFNKYINQLSAYINQSYGDLAGKIKIKVNSENVYLNINTAIPCGMIINELVSNSFKHAFPDGRSGEICIDLSSDNDGFRLILRDNGIGIKGDANIKDSKTLGFLLIDTLVKQIDGDIRFDTINGFECEIHFKGLK